MYIPCNTFYLGNFEDEQIKCSIFQVKKNFNIQVMKYIFQLILKLCKFWMPFNTYHIGFFNSKFDFEGTIHFVFLSSVKYRRETKNTSPIELQVDFRMNSYMNDVQWGKTTSVSDITTISLFYTLIYIFQTFSFQFI